MDITEQMIDKLANLAKLSFTTNEKATLKTDLQKVITFVEKINELELDGIPPKMHMSQEVNVLREDDVQGSITRESGLSNAPLANEAYFKVPKVIKK